MNNYHITEIGRSKNSVVYKGRLKKTIEYMAIKSSEKLNKLKVMNEVRILQNLAHENIIKYHSWHKTRNHFWLVLEYCPGGDILTLIDQDKCLPESVIKEFGLNIIDGLYYLHSNGIIYADLKPSNILFNEYGVLKLCDFGLARLISDVQSEETKKGTPYYMAPELFEEGGVYSYYSDLWSLGCVLYELAVGTPPFVSSTFKDLKDQILGAEIPPITNFSASFYDLISGLLQKNPSKRMSWEELLWHEFWEGKRMTEVKLPIHNCYEEYLKNRGMTQRSKGFIRDNKKFDAKESLRASLNGKEDFIIKSRDQVFNIGENWDIDDRAEEAKIVHQRSNSAILQTPSVKNTIKPQPLDQLLIHLSDINVKPIIEGHENLIPHNGFPTSKWTPENIGNYVNDSELEGHFSEVYSILTSNEKLETKMNYLEYIEYLIQDFPLANKLINSAFVALFLKLITLKSPETQGRICSLFGQMLRHATMIDSDLPNSQVSEAFLEIIIKEENKKTQKELRKKAFAALGEYLFYAATQMDEEEYDEAWEIDSQVVTIITSEILESIDESCKFLAIRTVENITAQSKNGGIIFATREMISALCKIVLNIQEEEMKVSAVAALSHIIRLNPDLSQVFINLVGSQFIFGYLKDCEERSQQALISIFCSSFHNGWIFEVNINVLIELLESPGIVIRGKVLLCFMYLLKHKTNYLVQLANTKFFSILDRLLKDSYKYVQDCLHHLLEVLSDIIMSIFKLANTENYTYFFELPKIFQSVAPRVKLPFQQFIKAISNLLVRNSSEVNEALLKILEAIITRRKQLKTYSECIISELLPSIIITLTQPLQLDKNVDTQYRFLKVFSDIMIPFLFDDEIYNFPNNSKFSTKGINNILVNSYFPNFGRLQEDSELIQGLNINLMHCILLRCPQYMEMVKAHGLVKDVLHLFTPELKNLSTNLLIIIQKLVESEEILIESLLECSFVQKINSVLKYVVPYNHNIEVILDILSKFLIIIPTKIKDKNYAQVYGLTENLNICTDLLPSEDSTVSEKSAECIVLILQIFGNSLTTGCTLEQGKALLEILSYNKSSLQKACIRTLRGVVKNLNIPGVRDKIKMMRMHDNEEISKIAVEIFNIETAKGKNSYN